MANSHHLVVYFFASLGLMSATLGLRAEATPSAYDGLRQRQKLLKFLHQDKKGQAVLFAYFVTTLAWGATNPGWL
jgi:hypothetical protein